MTIPEGLQLSLIDLATPTASKLSGAEVTVRPPRGATGSHQIEVDWSHPVPTGEVRFTLRVYASPDGTPPPVVAPITEPGSHVRLRQLVEQDAPVDIAVNGPLAETFKTQILDRGGQLMEGDGFGPDPYARSQEAITATTVVVVIAVIAAICIALGFALFGAVLFMAMQKGYNIEDAGYKVAVGEGATRQEHEMVFNIRKPGT